MSNPYYYLLTAALVLSTQMSPAQEKTFDRQDTLRGALTPERVWWDLTYYHLHVDVDIDNKYLSGKNVIHYRVLQPGELMQIDLQAPMRIERVTQAGQTLEVSREGAAHFIRLNETQRAADVNAIEVYYAGKPTAAALPPWDGGITWTEDKKGQPFVASSCQGIGASVWWPCKDHPKDEPDSALISVTVPSELMDVSNGRLRAVDKNRNGTSTYHWFVANPINSYGVNINIGNYVHFGRRYQGELGELDMDFYVLKYNLKKAKKHFKQADMTMQALEHWFGPYPFYSDSYKLVEAPYLGMEHQSSITYGNGYQNGYLGIDLSGSGWGLKFDFIIVHESGHEWFANSITNADVADMWIHESFTAYSESLFLDYHFGKQASSEYVIGTRRNILNKEPIIGIYGVNQRGSGADMYYKGSNMLHTLRQLVNDDKKWRDILRGLNREFYHQTVSSGQVESYIANQSGLELDAFFNQYLRDTAIPVLEYLLDDEGVQVRWINCRPDFDMPVRVWLDGEARWIKPTTAWMPIDAAGRIKELKVDPNFYVDSLNTLGK